MITRLVDAARLPNVIAEMQRLIYAAAGDELFLAFARSIIANEPFENNNQLSAVFRYVKAHVTYQLDPADDELLTAPHRMMLLVQEGKAFGDCDCQAMFCVAIYRALGYNANIVLLDVTGTGYTHAATEVYSQENNIWYYCDPTIDVLGDVVPASEKTIDEPGSYWSDARFLPAYKRKMVVS